MPTKSPKRTAKKKASAKPAKRAVKKAPANPAKAMIDAYLAKAPAKQRAVLKALRAQIQKAAPQAVEVFGYGMGGFIYHDRPLLYYAYFKNHCALYGVRAKGFEKDLKDFVHFTGTVQFFPQKPLPATLVKRIVKSRIASIDA